MASKTYTVGYTFESVTPPPAVTCSASYSSQTRDSLAPDDGAILPSASSITFYNTYNNKAQMTANNNQTWTLSGYDQCKVTRIVLNMRSNGSSGEGSCNVLVNTSSIGGIADAPFSDPTWNGAYSTAYVDIDVPVTATTVAIGGTIVIQINCSKNSLYCQKITVYYEAPADITLKQAHIITRTIAEIASENAWADNSIHNSFNVNSFISASTATDTYNNAQYVQSSQHLKINAGKNLTFTVSKPVYLVACSFTKDSSTTVTLNGSAYSSGGNKVFDGTVSTFILANTYSYPSHPDYYRYYFTSIKVCYLDDYTA